MNTRLFIGLVLIAIGLYWFSIQPKGEMSGAVLGKQSSDFTLTDEKGQKISLHDYRGKIVLVHFWATWCSPCVGELPLLDQFQKKFSSGEPFVVLPISVDEEGKKAIDAFRKRVPFEMTALLDPNGDVADKYGTYRLPESYLVDKEGKIIQKIVGPQNWTSPSWEQKIRGLLTP